MNVCQQPVFALVFLVILPDILLQHSISPGLRSIFWLGSLFFSRWLCGFGGITLADFPCPRYELAAMLDMHAQNTPLLQ
jgi:hypothetical protein